MLENILRRFSMLAALTADLLIRLPTFTSPMQNNPTRILVRNAKPQQRVLSEPHFEGGYNVSI
jgi:hypothetical protein